MIAGLLHGIGERIGGHRLAGDGAEGQRHRIVVIHGYHALAGLHLARDVQDIALPLGVDVVTGIHLRQVEHRIGMDRLFPYLPHRVVLGSQPPKGEGLDAQRTRRAHLVEDGDRVEEPDLMADMRVVVVVGEVDVERVGIELDLRIRIVGCLPCVLGRHLLGRQHLGHKRLRRFAVTLRLRGRQRHRPVVAIAAQRADDLLLGHRLEHLLEVVEKPVLGGDRPWSASRLVLVVVHQQKAVGVVRHELQIEAVVAHRCVDIQLQVARLEVLVERGEQRHVARPRLVGNLLEVQRNPTVAGVGGEKLVDLLDKIGARRGVQQEVADRRLKDALDRIVVVDQGKDLRVFARLRNGAGNPPLVVHPMHSGRVHHGEGAIVQAIRGQRAVRSHNVNPLRKEQIDLVDVLLQRGVAGRIVLHVVGRAQAFAGVQRHLGGLEVGLAVRRVTRLLPRLGRVHLQRGAVALGRRQQQLGQRRHMQQADHKQNPNDNAEHCQAVEDSPQPPPALALRIEKDLLVHISLRAVS